MNLATVDQPSLFGDIPQPRKRSMRDVSGQTRKTNGQWLAAAKAGALWYENALIAFDKFVAVVLNGSKSGTFTFEDFRVFYEQQGGEAPASLNAWGALPGMVARRGKCRWTGQFKKAVRPESHARFVKLWEVVG